MLLIKKPILLSHKHTNKLRRGNFNTGIAMHNKTLSCLASENMVMHKNMYKKKKILINLP